jgi:hypothetical protein
MDAFAKRNWRYAPKGAFRTHSRKVAKALKKINMVPQLPAFNGSKKHLLGISPVSSVTIVGNPPS